MVSIQVINNKAEVAIFIFDALQFSLPQFITGIVYLIGKMNYILLVHLKKAGGYSKNWMYIQ